MAAAKRRRRHPALLVTALLLGVVLAAVAVEIAFRLFWTLPPWFAEVRQAGMYTATADGGVALQPGYRGTLQIGDERETTVALDSLGMRGPDIGPRKPGERRVLMLGDSLVFGYGVEGDEALPARVEAALRAAGAAVVVGNAGVPGEGSRRAVAQMARLDQPFGADAFVVCGYLGNDALDDCFDASVIYAGLRFDGVFAQLVQSTWRMRLAARSRAALWLETWLWNNKPDWSLLPYVVVDPVAMQRTVGLPPMERRHAGLFLDVTDAATVWEAGAPPIVPRLLATLKESLQRAQQIAGDRPLVFVVLPTVWQVNEQKRVERLQQLGFDPKQFERGIAQRRWMNVAKELGVRALDATPILEAEPDHAGLFITDGGHFSVRGNRVVGEWLARQIAPWLRS